MYRRDTIVAGATPVGRSAIAVVRLSGAEAVPIAQSFLRGPRQLESLDAWRLARFAAVDPSDDEAIDDVLAVRMTAPRSYTGEHVVEIHCHGSPVLVDSILRLAVLAGARLAEPGEFTRRAVLNGRMDLVQAEAVAELIEAPALRSTKAAWRRLAGDLSEELAGLRGAAIDALALLETYIDFSDEDLPDEDLGEIVAGLGGVREKIAAILTGFAASRRVRDGHRVVIVGKPNVGKSSILNSLAGFDRAVVTDEPGTTRDAVAEIFDLDGVAVTIVDTAGLRLGVTRAEEVAIDRSRRELVDADVVVRVFDSSRPLDAEDEAILGADTAGRPVIDVLNKSDLGDALRPEDRRRIEASGGRGVRNSAVTAGGCAELKAVLRAVVASDDVDASPGANLGRERHRAALERADAALCRGLALISSADQTEVAAAEVREALKHLATVTESLDDDNVLDVIFSRFCIGK